MEKSSHLLDEEIKSSKLVHFQAGDFSHVTIINSYSLFIVYSALLGASKVILINLNYHQHDENHFNQLITRTNFLKIKSKHFLKRLGYISDKRNQTLTLVYERPDGKILDFESIYDFGDNEVLRLFLYQQILNIVTRLKKAGVTLGYLAPNLFYFNTFSAKPLLLIEFNLLSIYHKIQDPVLKISFGYFKYSHSNDLAMLLVFLVKLFVEDIPYEVLLYKFYLEFIGKTPIKGITFSDIVNNMTNQNVKAFVRKYKDIINNPKTKNNIPKIEEEYENILKFQHDFKELYTKILKFRTCSCCGKREAEGVAQICYEVLCSACEIVHQCPKKELFDLQINRLKLETHMSHCTEIDNSFNRLPKFSICSEEQLKKFYKTFDKIATKQHEMPLIAQHKLENALKNLVNNVVFSRKNIASRCEEFEKALVEFQRGKGDEKDLAKHIDVVRGLVNSMEKSAEMMKNFDNSQELKKIIEIISNYQYTLQYYKSMVVRSIFQDSMRQIKVGLSNRPNLIKTNKLNGIIIDYLFNKKEIDEFFIPIGESNKLMGITDISPDGLEYTKEEIDINFTDEIINYFPNELQWTRLNNFLFICGGITKGDDRVTALNNTWILNLTNFDLYNLSPMLTPRHNHSICKYNRVYIIAVSGSNTPTCELYNLTTNKWESLPSLKKARNSCTIVIFNQHYLYCIGGLAGNAYCNTIEVLDLIKKNKWEEYQIDGSSCSYNLINAGILKNDSKDVIVLLGGKDTLNGAISEDMYEFSFETFLIAQKEVKLPYACYFYDRNLKKSNKRTQIAFTYDNLEMLMRIEI
jgi:hypothetical protein